MVEPSVSSGLVRPTLLEYDAENIGSETNKLIQRLARTIIREKTYAHESISVNEVVQRTVKYTGIHANVIIKMMVNEEPPVIEHKDIEIDRRLIQDSLIKKYDDDGRMPTITELFNAVEYVLPCYVDIHTFKRILTKLGYDFVYVYVFHKNDKQRTFYVMEKKTVTFQRYKYLKTIQQYRNDKTPIYYIGILSIDNADEILSLEKSLQTDPSDIFQHIFFTANENIVEHIKIVTSLSYDVLKMWLINYVLPNLPIQSVCVLDDSEIYRKTLIDVPTLNSVKVDMVEWLEYHNIPCDIEMSKSELLKLIETYTNKNENIYALDNIVESYNHSLIRLPECITGLSIAAQVLSLLDKKVFLRGTANTVLSNISKKRLNIFSDRVQKEEMRVLKEDKRVDNMLDKIVENTKENTINEEDFLFDFSDSE